jgi:hypothetical protein
MPYRILYRNETGRVVRRRDGGEVRPLDEFWTDEYEPDSLGLTIVEDRTSSVVMDTIEHTLDSTPYKISIPRPNLHPYLTEILVRQLESGEILDLGFNKATDETASIDEAMAYNERVDTRKAHCLYLSGSGTARVIFKEVLR